MQKALWWGISVASLLATTNAAAVVSPIVADYGEVFPTLIEQNLSVFRNADPAPWYVSFNLLADANVKLGVQELPAVSIPGGTVASFDVTAIRIVTINGLNVAFGTDSFVNPFPDPIVALVVANALPAGRYALAVSGSGDRYTCGAFCNVDLADFVARIQVTPVPELQTATALLAGLALLTLFVGRRRP